jgi:serine-type D-Ala-D-Ala carboxypeptidase/endopeptidase (penicillin-binding protein 4)
VNTRLLVGALLLTACGAVGCAANATPASPSATPASSNTLAAPTRAVRHLRDDLSRVFGAKVMERGVWGVEVRSLESGERLFELNAGKLMMPASNMKVVTLAATAETLGWDYRFTTTLETTATVQDGVLAGDLIVRSNGDPTINRRENRAAAVIDQWAEALRAAGIQEISGRIIGDDQAFDDEGIGDGWSWDYLQFGYAAPVGALQINENIAQLMVLPGAQIGEPAVVTLSPGAGFTLLNRATTGAEGSEDTIAYRRHLDSPTLEISGSTPIGGSTATRSVAVVNPTVFFVQTIKDGLAERGIRVKGDAVDIDDVAPELMNGSGPRRVLVSTPSPPLNEIATVLMKVSQNLYAETFMKAIGTARGGLGTASGGRSTIRRILSRWSVPNDSYVISDGSGLSRYNYLSAEMITEVLERMFKDDRHRESFVATLPIAGRDGTMATRMRHTRAEGNAVAKTGSIANTRSLSGFVRTRDNEMLVFSILANDFVIPADMVNWIADLAVETLSNFTRR